MYDARAALGSDEFRRHNSPVEVPSRSQIVLQGML